ncbi:D-lactate ferricytochrome c oxidoreductase [Tilletia horrida]|uniref:Protein PBDC1 homolog n=1 Tax=Tilletia horrida TaxID=155126 RepID=A0AAN6JTL1_9BASI|nr:D-lactate ferricytochrome c oxidoreductase [Tilletia horrida]KAK0556142.1 D-lactate ferricytochrome c oxidoreductase [Tilletia horrida]KAK0569068.1 D-lactate ferricytochrome c oxidoreductase [Tilletia horrida]
MAEQQAFDPNKAQNLPEIEKQMAVKCVEHAQVYWNLLEKVQPTQLKLTKLDDDIYADFQATFPEYSESENKNSVLKLDEEAMKSAEGKERWRNFMNKYEGKVADFNFGTLIRTDGSDEYTQFNTTFVMRMQFYVFEIARNRRGLNDWVYQKAQKEAAKEAAKKAKGKK